MLIRRVVWGAGFVDKPSSVCQVYRCKSLSHQWWLIMKVKSRKTGWWWYWSIYPGSIAAGWKYLLQLPGHHFHLPFHLPWFCSCPRHLEHHQLQTLLLFAPHQGAPVAPWPAPWLCFQSGEGQWVKEPGQHLWPWGGLQRHQNLEICLDWSRRGWPSKEADFWGPSDQCFSSLVRKPAVCLQVQGAMWKRRQRWLESVRPNWGVEKNGSTQPKLVDLKCQPEIPAVRYLPNHPWPACKDHPWRTAGGGQV